MSEGGTGSAPVPSPRVPAPVAGACAMHAERAATAVCERCGGFMCAECAEAPLCPPCRERVGWAQLPFDRQSWDPIQALTFATEVLRARLGAFAGWGAALLFGTVFLSVLAQVAQFVWLTGGGDPLVGMGMTVGVSFLGNVLTVLLQAAIIVLALDVIGGRSRSVGAVLLYAVRRFPVVLGSYALLVLAALPLAGLWVGLALLLERLEGTAWTVLLVVALILAPVTLAASLYVMPRMSFIYQEILFDPSVGPLEAIRRCWRLTRGQWFKCFLTVVLAFLVVMAGYMVLCVGIVLSMPLSMLLTTVAFLAMRRGSDLPEPARAAP